MLVHPTPGIGPVIKYLAAQDVPAQTPDMLIFADLFQMLVADEDIVHVLDLEGHVVEAGLVAAQTHEGVVVDVFFALIDPVEGGDDVVFRAGIDIVRADQAKVLAVPGDGRLEIGGDEDGVAQTLDVRGAPFQAGQLADPAAVVAADVDGVLAHGQRLEFRQAPDDFDLIAVWIGQADALATAWLVDRLDGRGALDLGGAGQVVFAGRIEAQANGADVAFLGDVDMVLGIAAAHVERVLRARGPGHAEVAQEFFLGVQIGCAEPGIGDVGDFDHDAVSPALVFLTSTYSMASWRK